MPRLIFSRTAIADLERLRGFLRLKSPRAAARAIATITAALRQLENHPAIGRPVPEQHPAFRELVIAFGESGYVARYAAEGPDRIVVLTLRHQKETGLFQE